MLFTLVGLEGAVVAYVEVALFCNLRAKPISSVFSTALRSFFLFLETRKNRLVPMMSEST